jgi:phosphoglycolate phosphatase
MTIKHILFDFDGTLIDSAPCILSCYQQVLDELSIRPAVPVTEEIIGPPLKDTVAMLAATDDETLISKMAARFMECYDKRVASETPTYDTVQQVLVELKQLGYQLYIATNKRHVPTMAVIEHLKLTDFFTAIGAVDQMPPGQQKKGLLIGQLIKQHEISTEQALYIGDKMDDFLAADENAMAFAAAGWGYGQWQSPHTVLNKPKEIMSYLKSNHDS